MSDLERRGKRGPLKSTTPTKKKQKLLKDTCVNETIVCVSRNDDDGSTKRVVDSEDSSSSTDEYDVFLSFRGSDTRRGFTDVLYDTMKRAGIRVFRDDDEVSIGQPLQKILHAIETSLICVPIFSPKFASSTWCLREVARMMELKKVVMPIFYDVTPDDVKLKTKAYRKDLSIHEKKNGKEKVKVWEDALKEVSRIKGKEVLNTGYTEFCKMLVDEGLSKLRPRKRSDDESLVGIDCQIKFVMNLMAMESSDVLYIGIHGMGGIGKTTLAKYLFNKLSTDFDSSYFLSDVRDSSLRCNNGLQDLRNQLQAGLDPEFSKGCNSLRIIEERFCSKKVLIVLDDVDKLEQIEKLAGHSSWFGFGSRIIVTTRNMDVLKKYGNLVRLFKMMTLEHDRAHELFQRYAFREEKHPSILETISREIVSIAGGLPLALKVMGSSLYNNKEERVWRDVLERSRKVQDLDVTERLRISYDALADDQKRIFLDIACIPDMEDKVKSVSMWEASKLFPHFNLGVLYSMSLLEFKYNRIWMHDVLRDLGKNIAGEDHSRVWKNEEAIDVLLSKEGQEKVEVFSVDEPLELSLTSEHFAKFGQLRVLKLVGGIDIQGDFKVFLPKLTWLTWNYFPQTLNIINLSLKKLVILNLSHSFIDESWGGWNMIKNLNNLKDLDLSYCRNLTRTPDFSEINQLERLTLYGCSELREIHSSVGKLQRLKYLDLSFCRNLTSTPDFSEFNHLESLTLFGCSELREIHSSVGKLQRLKYLDLSYCRNLTSTPDFSDTNRLEVLKLVGCGELREIHGSVGKLQRLKVLNLEDCDSLGGLPDEIGGLVSLEKLGPSPLYSPRKPLITFKLLETVGDLKSLVDLELINLDIMDIPDSIGGLVKLKRMFLHTSAKMLPESLGDLKSLGDLALNAKGISNLPNSLGNLAKLWFLSLTDCSNLEELPESLGSLQELKILHVIGENKIRKIPVSIGKLRKLNDFKFDSLGGMLEELPIELFGLSSRLLNFTLKGSSITTLPFTISQHPVLQHLYLVENHQLQELPDLPLSLTHLSVSSMSSKFNLDSLTLLVDLTIDFQPKTACVSLLPSLDLLDDNCQSSKMGLKLPDLSGLKYLSTLRLQNWLIEDERVERLGIQHLGNVTTVTVENCGLKLIEQICLMKNLKNLSIHKCKELVEIPGLENLKSLEKLDISVCGSLERLGNLSKLEKLSRMSLFHCPKLRIVEVEGTDRISFNKLFIVNCASLQNVEDLKKKFVSVSIDGIRI